MVSEMNRGAVRSATAAVIELGVNGLSPLSELQDTHLSRWTRKYSRNKIPSVRESGRPSLSKANS
jgi:hypothetical protein